MKQRLLIAILLCFAAGCNTTASLEKLRTVSLDNNRFYDVLARLYQGFAESELESYDWWSSRYFADKGLQAATQQQSAPEDPDHWRISEHHRIELKTARASLLRKLTPTYMSQEPLKAATLQFAYDCWVEEQEEGWDIAAIEACKKRFYNGLDETDMPTRIGGPLSTSYLIHFDWGARQVSGMAREELMLIASHLNQQSNYEIIINGHADRSGSDEFNMALSQDRAEFIRDTLESYGVPDNHITYYAFGESDPLILTEDGVRTRENRRVEIFIE